MKTLYVFKNSVYKLESNLVYVFSLSNNQWYISLMFDSSEDFLSHKKYIDDEFPASEDKIFSFEYVDQENLIKFAKLLQEV